MTFVQGGYRTISIMTVIISIVVAGSYAWANGTGPLLVTPGSIAIESSGTILVVDQASSRKGVVRIDPVSGDRTTVSNNFGTFGTGVALEEPANVAVMGAGQGTLLIPDGSILLTDLRLDAVVKIHPMTGDREVISGCTLTPDPCPAGQLIGAGDGFADPEGIVVMPDGTIVVADKTLASLYKIDSTTGNRTLFSGPSTVNPTTNFVTPKGIVSDGFLGLYVTDTGLNAVFQVDGNGNREIVTDALTGSGPIFESPRGIARASDGSLRVVDPLRNALVRVDLNGTRTDLASVTMGSPPNTLFPVDVAIASDGAPLVVDSTYGAVFRIDEATGNRTVLSRESTLTITPSSGLLLQGQAYNLVLLAIGPGNNYVNLVATLDDVDVTTLVAPCLAANSTTLLPGGGVSLSCPNIQNVLNLTPGQHTFSVSLNLQQTVGAISVDGPTLSSRTVWNILVPQP